jgi:alpha-1,3-rhamnosyl/mannosyltransferase
LALAAFPWHFAAYTRAFKFDLYHEPNFVPFKSHLPTVVTVHDLSVVRFPQWHPAYRVANHEKAFLPGLQRAAHIVTDTEAVRQEVIALLSIPPEKVTSVPIGIGPQFQPQTEQAVLQLRMKFELPEQFFLCVGTVEPRKNLLMAMRAFADLPADVRSRCPLVLAGPWGWRSEAEREFFDYCGQSAGIRHLGYISDDDLPVLYSAARVLVYPSHYEGFGLPPLEMLACGGGVLASTDPALGEVLAGHGELIDANDCEGWRNAMQAAATDEDYLRRLRSGGIDHARTFTWECCAEGTAEVYRKVLSQG